MSSGRSVRIFLNSTFRDFGEERDLLVRRVFPALRAKLKDRFVELVDVDLRWDRPELAESYYRRALAAFEVSVGLDHRWAVATAANLRRLLSAKTTK